MTASKTYDVVAIGNAIVDVVAFAEDAFICDQNMNKGAMQLIDKARGDSLYQAMGPCTEVSGGSAATPWQAWPRWVPKPASSAS